MKAILIFGVVVAAVYFVAGYDPHGASGCRTYSSWGGSGPEGQCWRFCNGSRGQWCYTGINCDDHVCYEQTQCSRDTCPEDDPNCVTECRGPDPSDCGSIFNDTVRTCEHYNATLECSEEGQVIKILSANYGRTLPGDVICPHDSILVTNCSSVDSSTPIVAEKCNGKTKCQVPATNSLFGDPCRGTYKYLQVQFTCV